MSSTNTVLLPQLFPPSLLTLGQFLQNPLSPTVNPFITTPALPGPEDYTETPPIPYNALVSLDKRGLFSIGLTHLLGLKLSYGAGDFLHINADELTYRTLKNSDATFAKICQRPEARAWMEEMALFRKPFYFVVGLQELRKATITRAILNEGKGGGYSTVPLDAAITLPIHARGEVSGKGFATSESKNMGGIFGIEVRQVRCRVKRPGGPLLDEKISWKYTYQRVKGAQQVEEKEMCVRLDTVAGPEELADLRDEQEDSSDDDNDEDEDEEE